MELKNYIFITTEGYTYSPNNSDSEPDVENCQVLGFAIAVNSIEAFIKLKENNSYLKELGFREVLCYELRNMGKSESFTL